MSRYEEFQEEESSASSILNEEDQQNDLVCIRNLLANPNPLMNKIQFAPYEPKNYYPVLLGKLPPILSHLEYHVDPNNMAMLDQSVFSHQKMKKDLARFLAGKGTIHSQELLTLGQFYSGKSMIYQKYQSRSQGNYFATYVLNMSSMKKEQGQKAKAGFIIRSTKTPVLADRCRTERLSLVCRPQIEFNSNFESGNLFKAFQREYNEYDLILQNDINTRGNNQWFFFSVRNVPKGTTVKFNIVNMAKRFSLFDYGMKPSVFSMMRFERRQVGWVRDGSKLNYRQNTELKKEGSECPYYTLSFQYRFNYDGDVVYFSYSIPYTFSNLCTFISQKLEDRTFHSKVRVRSLGQTLGGNEVSLLELTNAESRNQKKAIWVLGRQHSGEVTSSFMVEGIINFLLSERPDAMFLMDHFYFKIVPMLNIDGVVHGNTRAELSGCDPNRKWADPSRIYQPIVYSIKKMIEKDSTQMILDLHSHSRKLGTFFYCNSSPQHSNTIKIFPMMVCKNDERFDYRSNRFKGGNDQTARRVFYEILGIPYIYTIESSLYGYQKQNNFRIIPYQPNDYREMGASVFTTFSEMVKKRRGTHPQDLKLLLCNSAELEEEGNLWDRMNEVDEIESVGSDEDPAADEFSKKELDAVLERMPKKVKKTKKKPQEKVKVEKKMETKKEEEPRPKRNDKQSYYRKFFSGRSSLNGKQGQNLFEIIRPKAESRPFACQVDFPERAVLHKSSMNVMTSREASTDKMFEKKSLCVVGLRVEDDLIINGLSVGVQTETNSPVFRNRNEVQVQSKTGSRRVFRSSNKVASFALHNQNNFLNKGDILHTALRMLSKR